jgi:methionyl-tRNA formyltransferase
MTTSLKTTKMMMKMTNNPRFAFFGTAPLAVGVLEALKAAGCLPSLIVAGPDTIETRKKQLVFPCEKIWGIENDIEVIQPKKIDADFIATIRKHDWDVFVVASYGKLLPQEVFDIPVHGVLNMHPSLLPRLRGPSPIRSTILTDERETGVSVILLDAQMDHGPLIAQRKVALPEWPMHGTELDALLAREGGALLAHYMERWLKGEVETHEQNHDLATYCSMFKKEDGLLDLNGDPYQNLLKIRAYEGWPGTYAYSDKGERSTRIKILDAHIEDGKLIIDHVIPEGKRAMSYEEFMR